MWRIGHLYADDVAIISRNKEDLDQTGTGLEKVVQRRGFKINEMKTKSMEIRRAVHNIADLKAGNHAIEHVESFSYFGSQIN